MVNKVKKYSAKAVLLMAALSVSGYSYAAPDKPVDCNDPANYLPLANGIADGWQKLIDGTATSFQPTKNSTVCVDINNHLTSNYFVFDIDTPVTKDGTVNGTPSAFNHMWLMGSANLAAIKKAAQAGKDLTASYSIRGIIHGSALKWALNDAWWKAQVDDDGRQLYPDGNPNKAWFDKLDWLNKHGMDIQLEVCGVTLSGAGLTHADVYPGILVNQGAFGRMSRLHQDGYAVVSEGWVDTDKHHGRDRDHDRR